jgi:hypothetical protein
MDCAARPDFKSTAPWLFSESSSQGLRDGLAKEMEKIAQEQYNLATQS